MKTLFCEAVVGDKRYANKIDLNGRFSRQDEEARWLYNLRREVGDIDYKFSSWVEEDNIWAADYQEKADTDNENLWVLNEKWTLTDSGWVLTEKAGTNNE